MKDERQSRQDTQFRQLLKAAGFHVQEILDEFDFSQLNESVSLAVLWDLASCQFAQDWQNVVMIGNP